MSTFIKDELELTIKESLEQIVDHFHLDEVGSPYMELHAFADGMLDGGAAPKLGDVRVWHPRADTEDSPTVEKLVHLKFSVKSLTSQWLFAFSSGNSLVPHFSLGLSTSGFSEATCGASGVHVDLISKVPLSVSSSEEYTQRCYHPLRAARDNILSTLSALPTHGSQLEIDTMQKEVVSPYLLAVQIEEQLEGAAAPLVVGGVQAYLRHWTSLHRSPQLQLGASGAWFAGTAEELWRSDQAVRALLFSVETDPLWRFIDRVLGRPQGVALRELLRNRHVLVDEIDETEAELGAHLLLGEAEASLSPYASASSCASGGLPGRPRLRRYRAPSEVSGSTSASEIGGSMHLGSISAADLGAQIFAADDDAAALDFVNHELAELPPQVASLTSLTSLSLDYNLLTELPDAVGGLTLTLTLPLPHTPTPTHVDGLTRLTKLALALAGYPPSTELGLSLLDTAPPGRRADQADEARPLPQ